MVEGGSIKSGNDRSHCDDAKKRGKPELKTTRDDTETRGG